MSELIVATATAMTDGDTDQVVMMRVGTQDIAFAIQDVRDAVEPKSITPIPLAPSAIAGVMNLRGRIVTAIDLGCILGRGGSGDGGAAEMRDYSRMIGITIDRPEGPFAVLVDSISEVRRIERRVLEAPPATLDPSLKRLCTGVYQLPGQLVVLLDVDRILEPETILATPTLPFRPRRTAPGLDGSDKNRTAAFASPNRKAAAALAPCEVPAALTTEDAPDTAPIAPDTAIVAAVETAVLLPPAKSAIPQNPGPPPTPRPAMPILDGIGGDSALADIVAAFYDFVLADPLLAGFFAETDMEAQRARMVAALGPLLSTAGSTFATAEIGFDWLVPQKAMEDDHFNQCLVHFEQALGRSGIAEPLGERFLSAIEWCREGVVD